MTTQPTVDLYELADALVRSIQGVSNEKDIALINKWREADVANEKTYAAIVKDGGKSLFEKLRGVDTPAALVRIHKRMDTIKRRRWFAVAAAAITLLFVGLIIQQRSVHKSEPVADMPQQLTPNNILPATNKAVLVLADGSRVVLNKSGDTAFTHGTAQIRQQDGTVRYEDQENVAVMQQELITPKAGTYSIVLADGTTVWLNAASSLKFPNRFAGNERVVELSGEGYFEVAKNAQKPFKIFINGGSQVEVLGTVFNVKGYEKERVRTTLLEGSVRVSTTSVSKVIAPGEMAMAGTNNIQTGAGDIAAATAWKNNQFVFHQMPVREVMDELARWYNIELVYAQDYKQQESNYNGEISRGVTLDKLLMLLEQTGVGKFDLKGRTLYISTYK
jgi:transmembrane sensor